MSKEIIKNFRFKIIESPSNEIRVFNNNDVEEKSETPALNEIEDLGLMKMPVKQFYERSGLKDNPSSLSVSPFDLGGIFGNRRPPKRRIFLSPEQVL